jgi:hypothetical protein
VRNPGGVLICDGQLGRQESDTFTCGHCNKIVVVTPNSNLDEVGGMCRCCMKLICPTCVSAGICKTIEQRLEEDEARYHALRSYGF